jgi:hypothetical protein
VRVFTLIDLFTLEGLALEGRPGSWGADAAAVLAMTPPAFSADFKRSPMKRAKLRGLKRHAAVVLGSVRTADVIDLLTPLGRCRRTLSPPTLEGDVPHTLRDGLSRGGTFSMPRTPRRPAPLREPACAHDVRKTAHESGRPDSNR